MIIDVFSVTERLYEQFPCIATKTLVTLGSESPVETDHWSRASLSTTSELSIRSYINSKAGYQCLMHKYIKINNQWDSYIRS